MTCYTLSAEKTIPLTCVLIDEFDAWLEGLSDFEQQQIQSTGFLPAAHHFALLLNEKGSLASVAVTVKHYNDLFALADLSINLPEGIYQIENALEADILRTLALGWGLGAYRFSLYKQPKRKPAQLSLAGLENADEVQSTLDAVYLTRNLVNTPHSDMTPAHLAEITKALAGKYKAKVSIVEGNALKEGFPAIHAVGKSGETPPCLIELTWGSAKHKKVTLVGKGICFDSGGYNLKSSAGMGLMKKDMGGAAHVLGLASLIMSQNLPLHLTVLISAAENLVSAQAFKPGDILNTRKGLTVEVGNTDAEGRLVLSDALTYACEQQPDLIIDFATLTGAARVALGPEIATILSNQPELAQACVAASDVAQDPCWQLPLHSQYKCWLSSNIADLNNHSSEPFAGAIMAALFLYEFIDNDIPWLHLDTYAWNKSSQPGRPEGGEAIGLRAIYQLLKSYN